MGSSNQCALASKIFEFSLIDAVGNRINQLKILLTDKALGKNTAYGSRQDEVRDRASRSKVKLEVGSAERASGSECVVRRACR